MSWIGKLRDALKAKAATISKDGNKPLYNSAYDAWRSDLTTLSRIHNEEKGRAELDSMPRHLKHKPKDNKFDLEKAISPDEPALMYYYQYMEHPSMRDSYDRKANLTKSQLAAAGSVVGTGVSLLPFPGAPVVGGLMTLPDQLYDWSDLISEPSLRNAGHVGADYLEYISRLTPTKYDDAVAVGAKIVGSADDISGVAKEEKGGGIHIKEKNKGKFTRAAKAHGETPLQHAHCVLKDPNATKLLKKRALFVVNASKFKH